MAAVNLPPPPPLQFLQPGSENKVNWNWHDWFYRLQTLSANVNTTPNSLNMPPQFTVTGNNSPTLTVSWVPVPPGYVLAGPFPEFGNGIPLGIPAMLGGGSSGQPSFVPTSTLTPPSWAQTKDNVASGETLTILSDFQMESHISFTISGIVYNSGKMFIELNSPSPGLNFTADMNSGNLMLLF